MSWQKIVSSKNLIDGTAYILAIAPEIPGVVGQWMYWSMTKAGKKTWSTKPGIAMHIICNQKLREFLTNNRDRCALEIPADASTRWRARA